MLSRFTESISVKDRSIHPAERKMLAFVAAAFRARVPPARKKSHCQELATNIMSPNRLSACTNAAGTWQG
jgi:hypothetical protein